MSALIVRLSVLWQKHQMDVSLPAQRPIIDYLDEVIRLFYTRAGLTDRTTEIEESAHLWVLSSPTTGILSSGASLADASVTDGHQLYLTRREDAAHAPFVDDIMAELRHTIDREQHTWVGPARHDGLLLSIVGILSLLVFGLVRTVAGLDFPGLGLLGIAGENPADTETIWSTTRSISLALFIVITVISLTLSIWSPRPWTRWLSLTLPASTALIAASVLSTVPGFAALAWWVALVALSVIPAHFISSRKHSSALAGMVAAGLICVSAAIFGAAVFWGASPLAIAAWAAWVPVLVLLITPTVAVGSTGLAALLRRSDDGEPVTRERVRATALRTEQISRGIAWFTTFLAAATIVILNSGPYWQQGLIAGILAVVILLRVHGFSDTRIITPLLITGAMGLMMSAGSTVQWMQSRNQSPPNQPLSAHQAWWFDVFGTTWSSWLAAAVVGLIIIAIQVVLIVRQPDALAEARAAKFFSLVDAIACTAFIPLVLIGQGVITYYWATT